MSKTAKILITTGFIALIVFIVYSTTGLAKVSCEVCMEFRGRMSCSLAAGTTSQEALNTARGVACSDIAFGRDESIACAAMEPKSLKCK
jgi:hypothetical protein